MARYLVTGGLGFLGQYICHELLTQEPDCQIRIVSRTRKDTILHILDDLRVEFFASDLTSEENFSYLKDVDHVIHNAALVNMRASMREDLERINVEGTRRLVQACNRFPIKRFVHVSSVAAVGGEDGKVSDERTFLDPRTTGANPYSLSKARAEEVLRKHGSKLDYVIGCPSLIAGPGSEMIAMGLSRLRRFPILPTWRKRQNIIDVRDVAGGLYLILTKGKRKERYLLTNHHTPFDQFLSMIISELGWQKPLLRVPSQIIKLLQGPVWAYSRLSSKPLVTPRTLRSLLEDYQYSNQKIVNLGLRFQYTLDQTVSDMCSWMKSLPEFKQN